VILEVAFLPTIARAVERKLCIVVDVLRASTSLACMAEAGVRDALIAPDPAAARAAAGALGGALLAGEAGGRKPADFDLGNSPAEFRRPELASRRVVFCSSNGAKALHLLARAPAIMVGGFVNATATAREAIQLARVRRLDVCLVCAGDHGFERLGVEDVAGAGAIVLRMARAAEVELDESAEAAARLFRSYVVEAGGDETAGAAAAIAASRAGTTLRAWGLADDLADCARVDWIDRAVGVRVDGGRLTASPMAPPVAAPSGAG
jgi:2-phosphosulfolactate phosphatase